MKTGTVTSSVATTSPAANSAATSPGAWRMEVPVEAGQGLGLVEGRWWPVGLDGSGLEPGLEKTEHALTLGFLALEINPPREQADHTGRCLFARTPGASAA